MPRKKTINNSTDEVVMPTLVFDEYYDFNIMEGRVFSTSTAERWSKEIIEFAKKDDSLKVTDFFCEKGLHPNEGFRLSAKYEVLKNAYELAKYMIGSRREKGAIKNDYNPGIVHSSMSMYDPEWKANAEWKAKLAQDNQKAGNVTVLIERYPNTAIVPSKDKEKKEE